MRFEEVLAELKSRANPANVAGMARFGIVSTDAYGLSVPELRRLARRIGCDHALAEQLWASGVHEGRCLATLIADPGQVSEELMERWVRDLASWDVCDACACNLFDKTKFAWRKALEWSRREEEFVKRAGFAMMAALAVHDKAAGDEKFRRFLPAILRESVDERNFVKKAVNWALRQIGKRNRVLNREAIRVAREMQRLDSRSARWIAADALRELQSEAVRRRVGASAR